MMMFQAVDDGSASSKTLKSPEPSVTELSSKADDQQGKILSFVFIYLK
jgi:hypothetical protein